jgi:hypothetical protein
MYSITISGFKTRDEVSEFISQKILANKPEGGLVFYPDYLQLDKEEKRFKTNLNTKHFDVDIKSEIRTEEDD